MKASSSTNNTGYLRQKINGYLGAMSQWFLATPERALEQAYKAALIIKSIENEHFNGNKISNEAANYTETVMSYLQAELEKNLGVAKLRLAEFKASNSFINMANTFTLEKIRFIDEVIDNYTYKQDTSLALIPKSQPQKNNLNEVNKQPYSSSGDVINVDSVFDKRGVLPRSIGRTIKKIKTDLNPKSEKEVVKNFQSSRAKTKTAFRFILTIILVPFLIQQLSNQFLVIPILDHIRSENATPVFLNFEMKEQALEELHIFEEELKFASLVNKEPPLSREAIEEQVKHKANEIAESFRHKSASAVNNVFADMLAIIAFVFIVVNSKREIIILKSFMDEVVYGLSDSAKAFIIILFTDIFVGFHSPHGWEVIIEGLASHWGIAANKNLIFLFIATFPVILDTIFKYWIFRYLSRISPSAVATLRNMKE